MTVSIEGVSQIREKLGVILSSERRKAMMRHVGLIVLEKVKDHLDQMSATRHRTADRLGAPHSRYLEYASGRAHGTTYDGKVQDTVMREPSESSVTISIENTPGLRRAFGPMTITPKRARALTIPLHRVAYAKRVADLRKEGRKIFKLGKSNVLAESDGTKKGVRPLYCLVKKVTLSQDTGLLPTQDDYRAWGKSAAKGFLRDESIR